MTALHPKAEQLIRQVGKFGIVGIIAYIIDVGVFNLLINTVLSERPLASKIISSLVSIAFAFLGNRTWTFRPNGTQVHHHAVSRQAILFLLVNVGAVAIAVACLAISRYVMGLDTLLADNISANIIGVGFGTVFRFYGYRRWVFPTHQIPPRGLSPSDR